MKEIHDELIKWTQENKMLINSNETKEMILGKAKPENIPYLEIGGKQIGLECVSQFKILGLQRSNNLTWNCNIELICNKMSSKLYFLKLLKRSGLSIKDLQILILIRPISEYACTVN